MGVPDVRPCFRAESGVMSRPASRPGNRHAGLVRALGARRPSIPEEADDAPAGAIAPVPPPTPKGYAVTVPCPFGCRRTGASTTHDTAGGSLDRAAQPGHGRPGQDRLRKTKGPQPGMPNLADRRRIFPASLFIMPLPHYCRTTAVKRDPPGLSRAGTAPSPPTATGAAAPTNEAERRATGNGADPPERRCGTPPTGTAPHAFARRPNVSRHGRRQGMSTELPVVSRASRARCASAASFSAQLWLTRICTAPLETTSNSSAAIASRSARFAV